MSRFDEQQTIDEIFELLGIWQHERTQHLHVFSECLAGDFDQVLRQSHPDFSFFIIRLLHTSICCFTSSAHMTTNHMLQLIQWHALVIRQRR